MRDLFADDAYNRHWQYACGTPNGTTIWCVEKILTTRRSESRKPATHAWDQAERSQRPSRPCNKTVYAFGFDRLGFTGIGQEELTVDDVRIEAVPYRDARRLDSADGLIVPSGIFESMEDQSNVMGIYIEVRCDRGQLLSRFREFVNLIRQGKWVCCLLKRIIDTVPRGYASFDCRDTDLVKKVLNAWRIDRTSLPSGVIAHPKYDEFGNYIHRWGVAETVLRPGSGDHRILSRSGDLPVGLECDSQVLFLPFHTTRTDQEELRDLLAEVTCSTESYLKKRAASIPEWVDKFQFTAEHRAAAECQVLVERYSALEADRLKWRGYKGVLVRSGDALRETVAGVLKEYFGLRVQDEDAGIEDLAVKDDSGQFAAVIETKGTNGGVKREHINQVDSQRERRGVEPSIPGLLIINDFMDVPDFDARAAKPTALEHIRRARLDNVLIVRAVDLLRLMRKLEGAVIPERATLWIELCGKGGGILRESPDGSFIVDAGSIGEGSR